MSGLAIWSFVLFAVCIAHGLVIMAWIAGFRRIASMSDLPFAKSGAMPFISMIIPVRNAGGTIGPLLQDLHAQRSPTVSMEVVVIDDHSEDATHAIVSSMCTSWPYLRVLRLNNGTGKKAAISAGVATAQGDLVLLTDADGRCGPDRLNRLAEHWLRTKADLILMPVRTLGTGTAITWLQEIEQAALLGVAAGSAACNMPLLANGANMAVTRQAFNAVHGFAGDDWASGDDQSLLERIGGSGRAVSYLLHPDVVVDVEAEPDSRSFLSQRLRWAGKMRAPGRIGGSVLVLLALLLPWALFITTVVAVVQLDIGEGLLRVWLLLIGAWFLWSLPLARILGEAQRFLGTTRRVPSTLPAMAAFFTYAPLIAISSLFVRPRWKGRRV